MKVTGTVRKMQTEIQEQVQYYLVFPDQFVHMNQLLDKSITIKHVANECLNCGLDKKIWRQGFCYDCFTAIPQAGDWIMKPELSKAHLDEEDRDLEYEKKVQLQPHIVYLANSSNIKVGVTRKSQIPTRWIDQGAHEAIAILETPNRYLAGISEVALKEHVSDKTNWRKMLTNEVEDVDLLRFRESLLQHLPQETLPYTLDNAKEWEIEFPVLEYPKKVKSVNLTKRPEHNGVLKGIKGQYLIFNDGHVMNLRSHEGFVIDIEVH
ncbi:hypothetical protein BST91_10090 [Nonlabens tegetincola]|uniref:DUF2797 domain-containing protein n=1 Tax=Nonlabens tegetincola TaxID=323273 RepID=UPI000A2043A7|nr:DUF2797 domain-containing protein [Nonlabens tegetincola]ARN71978.1 hypothetical protein BST91_10090 [Nonlabens tegetincola]